MPRSTNFQNLRRWWLQEEPHVDLFPVVESICTRQSFRRDRFLELLRLYYANRPVQSFELGAYDCAKADEAICVSIGKSLVDTAVSKLTSEDIKPEVMTVAGDYSMQRQAELMNQFAVGLGNRLRINRVLLRASRDAAIFGSGFVKRFIDAGKIKVERVLPTEVIVDDEEARDDEPRSLYQVKEVHRDVLVERFPKLEAEIEASHLINADNIQGAGAGMVSVIESWHLPSGKKAKDGRHVLAVQQATLFDEKYEEECFPIHRMSWEEGGPVLGYYGMSLLEEQKDRLNDLNMIAQKLQRQANLSAVAVLAAVGSKINSEHLANEDGTVLYYEGIKPEWMNTAAMSPAILNYYQMLEEKCYNETGVSRLDAQSQKPAGLESGEALRQYAAIATERYKAKIKEYEQYVIDLYEGLFELARKLAARGATVEVLGVGPHGQKMIEWSTIDLDRDKYSMRVRPTAMFAADPAGKWQQVQEAVAQGFIGPDEGFMLLQHPDVEDVAARKTAPIREAQKAVETMLVDGNPAWPDPLTNLQIAVPFVLAEYQRAKVQNYPEERLQLLRNYLDEAFRRQQEMQAQQPPAAPAAPAQLPAQPPVGGQ